MTALKDSDGIPVEVDQGETVILNATFYDAEGNQFTKSAISSLTATLLDAADNSVINNRDELTVLDDNGGVLAADGSFELTLGANDNPINDETAASEIHTLILRWQWIDGNSDTQTGVQQWSITVNNIAEADSDPVTAATEATEGLDLSGIKRVKTKHIEIETHDPRYVQAARDKENTPHPTFCSVTFCKGTPKCP